VKSDVGRKHSYRLEQLLRKADVGGLTDLQAGPTGRHSGVGKRSVTGFVVPTRKNFARYTKEVSTTSIKCLVRIRRTPRDTMRRPRPTTSNHT
jgi:hypothetical protein